MQPASSLYMDWGTGICGGCCQDCGLWALAFMCPCVVYAQNLTLMRPLRLVSYVPFCDNQAAFPGCLHGTPFCATYFSSYFVHSVLGALYLVPIVMQCVTRGNVRDAYQIRAQCNCCEEFCCACCCMSCSLVQEQRQLMQYPSDEEDGHWPLQHQGSLLQHPRHKNTMRVLQREG
jgi:Cys-rich protein (TIGR01571 family)